MAIGSDILYSDELRKLLGMEHIAVYPKNSPITPKYKVFVDEKGSIVARSANTGSIHPILKDYELLVYNKEDPTNPLLYRYSSEHSGMKRKRTKRRRTLKNKSKRKRRTKSKRTRSRTRRARK